MVWPSAYLDYRKSPIVFPNPVYPLSGDECVIFQEKNMRNTEDKTKSLSLFEEG